MGLESVDKSLGRIEVQNPPPAIIALAPVEPGPTAEQALVVDQAFANMESERNPVTDAVWVASAGMILHDLVADTLAPPKDDDESDGKPPKKQTKEE
jgi:hypothetical protein